jgi:hypothetical protein
MSFGPSWILGKTRGVQEFNQNDGVFLNRFTKNRNARALLARLQLKKCNEPLDKEAIISLEGL